MTKQVQFRRGTTAQHTTFTGALAEITVDTDKKVAVVHDGSTAGGFELVGRTTTQTLTNKTLSSPAITGSLTGPANFIIDPAAVGDDTGTVEIKGNLTVQGTTTTINSTTSVLADPVIELRRGTSITAADGGIQVNLTTDGAGAVTGYQRIQWNNSLTRWETTDGTTAKAIVNTVDPQTIDGSKSFVNNLTASGNNATIQFSPSGTGSVTINPATVGSIDRMNIGATTRGTGAFTTLDANGNVTLGDADTDTITVNSQFVTGTQLKTAKTAANTLNLAAYDVDGTAYTNLITLTSSNTPTLALTSVGVGTINNMSIGATTKASGAFTSLAVKDTSANFDVAFVPTSSTALTGNRNLTFDVVNAARTIKLAGNIDIANNLTTSGNFALTLTTTAATNVTLPTTGTLVNTAVTTLSSLASIGTITTGTWNGSVIGATYGGTGVNNGSNTITLGGNFTTSGANAITLTTTGATNVTLPTSGTLATLSNTTFVGTTSIALNRTSGEQALTGITGFSTVAATGANSTGISIITGATTTSGNSGDVNIDVGAAATTLGVVNIATTNATTVNVGSTTKNTTLNVRGNATGGTATIGTNVTTGIVNLFTGVTGTINLGAAGAAIVVPDPATSSSAATKSYVDAMAVAMGL